MGKINSNISEWESKKKHYNEINNLVVALLLWGYFFIKKCKVRQNKMLIDKTTKSQ